jgi:hypothetical protein
VSRALADAYTQEWLDLEAIANAGCGNEALGASGTLRGEDNMMAASLSASKFFNTMSSGSEFFHSATSSKQGFGLDREKDSAAEVQDLDQEDLLMRTSMSEMLARVLGTLRTPDELLYPPVLPEARTTSTPEQQKPAAVLGAALTSGVEPPCRPFQDLEQPKRAAVQLALARASLDGSLVKALERLSPKPSREGRVQATPGLVAQPDAALQVLRKQAKETLLAASSRGILDQALAGSKKSEAITDTELLRKQAKATLMAASSRGKLNEAVAGLQKSEATTDTEQLRKQAKQTLLSAYSRSQSDETPAGLQKSEASTHNEQLRKQAKEILLAASSRGKLDEALAGLKKSEATTYTELLRDQAKATLLAASSSGKLDEALARLMEPVETAEAEQLRRQAKETLFAAASSRKLGEALASLKKQAHVTTDTEQQVESAARMGHVQQATPMTQGELGECDALKQWLCATRSRVIQDRQSAVVRGVRGEHGQAHCAAHRRRDPSRRL